VLFVTGRCLRGCVYCPLSDERRGKDLVFADEQLVENSEDILEEAKAIGALGTGITGGEPLLELEYVIDYIRMLKQEFGQEHHIHLYTGTLPNEEVMNALRGAGLDEIRFHPPVERWAESNRLKRTLSEAMNIGLEAGVEIPAFKSAPGIVEAICSTGAFLNLNELEFSETNARNLEEIGFRSHELHYGAVGSEEIAKSFMLKGLNLHYCPSKFKDAVQLRERLKRRAKLSARSFDSITDDGTLIYGVINGDPKKLIDILERLGVPEQAYAAKDNQIQIDPYVLEDISKELKSIGCIVSVVETYPTKKGLIVESIHL
jgi:pyruvate formate-lyase activating enzyme-like uncharacterized protein